MRRLVWILSIALGGCGGAEEIAPRPVPAEFAPPAHFPPLYVPADNPVTAEKVELGRYLFYDRQLSGNGTQSCGSCHEQAKAFTDGRALAIGSTDEVGRRNSPSLANVGYVSSLTWANPLLISLEQQILLPMFGEHPVELGLAGKEGELLARLAADPRYPPLFAAAFPDHNDPITLETIVQAVSTFQRTLYSGASAYDRWLNGDSSALSPSAERGRAMFFSERFECYHCHGGLLFTDSVFTGDTQLRETPFHNTGLYHVNGGYPAGDIGMAEVTLRDDDNGRYRAPSLRNVELTAPYMHDGSIATLDEVLDHYAAAGRTITEGPLAGVGADNPLKDGLVIGFPLSPSDRADLLAFLLALTDPELLTHPRYADPFTR
ncbi:MAG: di-heme enzyme [Deltaproteobacteria bacterium]|nr:di-heme enzyme [Deltaproteobacteria bacterium]